MARHMMRLKIAPLGTADGHDQVDADDAGNDCLARKRPNTLGLRGAHETHSERHAGQQHQTIEPMAPRDHQRPTAYYSAQLAEGDDRPGEGHGSNEHTDEYFDFVNDSLG
jgi:hypothetical protein